jgi:hypothetical protein
MFHTYFNQTNAMGYARVTTTANAVDNSWSFFGCGFAGTPNGMTCSATAILFYAPMARGPGNPNTIYFGSDVLYRSSDGGTTVSKVSQEPLLPLPTPTPPIPGVAISAIGISPQNDNVRVVGMQNGALWGTTTGSSTLTNLDPGNTIQDNYIGRIALDPDPLKVNTAYVTLSAFGVTNVWKTANLNVASPTWTSAAGSGGTALPQVPVNAIAIDPLNDNNIYVGTDIGVYISGDAGGSWIPFGTGLPRVAVFDMAIAPGRVLRIATHGRGLWQIPMFGPTAAPVTVSGRVLRPSGLGVGGAIVSIASLDGTARTARTNPFGYFSFDGIIVGQTYIVSVKSKAYDFASQSIVVNDSIADLVLVSTN